MKRDSSFLRYPVHVYHDILLESRTTIERKQDELFYEE